MNRIILTLYFAVVCIPCELAVQCRAQSAPQPIAIDAITRNPFPHFWEQMFGSGRAVLALREPIERPARGEEGRPTSAMSAVTPSCTMKSACTTRTSRAMPIYNFTYVDQIYDGMLANGVRPVVEISFMPRSWPPIRTRFILSGTSRTSRLRRTTRSGTT